MPSLAAPARSRVLWPVWAAVVLLWATAFGTVPAAFAQEQQWTLAESLHEVPTSPRDTPEIMRAVAASVSTSSALPSDNGRDLNPAAPDLSDEDGLLDDLQITRAIAAINQARARDQVCGERRMAATRPIHWDARTMQAARTQALYLQRVNQFGHGGENGSHVGERLTATGYRWHKVGENLAAGFNSIEEVVISWLASPSHCRVLMTPEFNAAGVSYVAGDEDNTYANYWALVMAVPQQAN